MGGKQAAFPVRRLTVLYDPDCPLCAFVRTWLERQRQRVPLDPVPVASEEARRRFPHLDHGATLREITVIGDSGQVYRGTAAWIAVLWALDGYRGLAHRLSTPAGRPFARAAVLAAARYRETHGSALTGPARPSGQAEGACPDGCAVPDTRPGPAPG
ncbi:DCC1-like thiol-disulfide oxidoreductase family protein [Streptomyces sp. YIM 98790]|uniref:thiol-disulfide oxidoreductase DCC family protein n=1 Tax=Streptomyces sp. YIM 98790 TaxID=2689077 RepID=UPI001408019B|nr:DCC1-like thiol-disulfide oxidoreductase family protein [Streptomyces sp. YIM 98790]